jgi:hypothetical protein
VLWRLALAFAAQLIMILPGLLLGTVPGAVLRAVPAAGGCIGRLQHSRNDLRGFAPFISIWLIQLTAAILLRRTTCCDHQLRRRPAHPEAAFEPLK